MKMELYPGVCILGIALLCGSCSRTNPAPEGNSMPAGATEVVLLTREGCVNTPTMRANLESAIEELGLEYQYSVVDQGELLLSDARCGYPTPTVLVAGQDLFDWPEPKPPFPAPS